MMMFCRQPQRDKTVVRPPRLVYTCSLWMSVRLHIDPPPDKESFFFERPIPALVKSVTIRAAGGGIKPYLTCSWNTHRCPPVRVWWWERGWGAPCDLSNRVATWLLLSLQNSFALRANAYIRKVCFFAPQAYSINEHNSGSLQLSPPVRHTHIHSHS